MAAERDLRIRLRRAVNDKFRINIEPKALGFFRAAAERTGDAGNAEGRRRRTGRGDVVREPAADEFGDFERAHPDAARLVNVDDAGQRLFLLGRPLFRQAGSFHRRVDGVREARQIGMAGAAQFLDGLRERQIVAHGVLDDLQQPRERIFIRDGGELRRALARDRIRRRDRVARDGDARPFAERGIKPKLRRVGMARQLDVREPVARLRVDVDFVGGMALDFSRKNPQHQMAVGGLGVQLILLLAGQVPVRVKPVRIARGEKQFFGAVTFRQFAAGKFLFGRRGAQ